MTITIPLHPLLIVYLIGFFVSVVLFLVFKIYAKDWMKKDTSYYSFVVAASLLWPIILWEYLAIEYQLSKHIRRIK